MLRGVRYNFVETFIDLPQPRQRFFVISKNLIRQNDDSRDAQHTAGFFDGELFSARFSVFQGSRRDDDLGDFRERKPPLFQIGDAVSGKSFFGNLCENERRIWGNARYCSKVRSLLAIRKILCRHYAIHRYGKVPI